MAGSIDRLVDDPIYRFINYRIIEYVPGIIYQFRKYRIPGIDYPCIDYRFILVLSIELSNIDIDLPTINCIEHRYRLFDHRHIDRVSRRAGGGGGDGYEHYRTPIK